MSTAIMNKQGRVVIPAEVRKQLHWEEGEELIFVPRGEGAFIGTRAALMKEIQDEVARLVPPGVSLVEELHKDRQDDLAKELAELASGK